MATGVAENTKPLAAVGAAFAAVAVAAVAAAPTELSLAACFAVTVGATAVLTASARAASLGSVLAPGVLLLLVQGATLVVGMLVYLLAFPVPSRGLEATALVHGAFLGAFLVAYLITRPRRATAPISDSPYIWARTPLLILLCLGFVGAYVVVLGALDVQLLLRDPFSARAATQSAQPSGVAWLLYKALLPAAAILVVLRATNAVSKPVFTAILLAIALAYLAYGARLQPLLLLLMVAMARDRFVNPISPRKLTAALLILGSLATLFAGYRYYATNNAELDRARLEATFARQASGTVAEFGNTIGNYGELPYAAAREVLRREIIHSTVPRILRGGTDAPQPFGSYISELQGRPEAGGLRIGPAGEIALAFGVDGVVVLGLILGAVTSALERLFSSPNPGAALLGIVGTGQMVFVLITGVSNAASSLAVVLMTAIVIGPAIWRTREPRLATHSTPNPLRLPSERGELHHE